MIFLRSFGCSENYYKNQKLCAELVQEGFDVYNQPCGSDRQAIRNNEERAILQKSSLVIVNTCTISEESEKTNQWSFIKKSTKLNNKAKIAIIGCSLRNPFSFFRTLKIKNPVLKINNKDEMLLLAKSVAKRNGSNKTKNDLAPKAVNGRFYCMLNSGCVRACSFCACSRYAFRKKNIRSLTDVLKQIKTAKTLGYSRIEFAGPCPGDWKDPNDPSYKFSDLLAMILKTTTLTIDFLELHPLNLDRRLIKTLSHDRVKKEEISIPIQSASDKMLRLMERGYNSKYLHKLFRKLFKELPDIKVSTDIILGFPFEDRQDIRGTLSFLSSYPFSCIDVYPYSERKGTPASLLKPLDARCFNEHYQLLLKCKGLKGKFNFLSTTNSSRP